MKSKIAYFVTEDWYFCSHRLPIARAARDSGLEVLVITRVKKHAETIAREGFRLIPLELDRGGLNVFADFLILVKLIRIYLSESPAIVHHVAMKPIIYGSLAAILCPNTVVINALPGLGYVFTSKSLKARVLRWFITVLFRVLFGVSRCNLILQNVHDQQFLVKQRVVARNRTALIRGSGVNLEAYPATEEPPSPPIVVSMISRMLWSKGVGELVEAARIVHEKNEDVKIRLVGPTDPENPMSISESQLTEWQQEGLVDYLGYRKNIPEILAQSHLAVLPSYREGVPKVLLEAAASSRAIIATDIPGCREVVRHGENGLLVPLHNPSALADAILRLATNRDRRVSMGKCGRNIAEREFSEDRVVEETMRLYHGALRFSGMNRMEI